MRTFIIILLVAAIKFNAYATEPEKKIANGMACVKIDAVKPALGSDSLVWLCVKAIDAVPRIVPESTWVTFYFELRDTNQGFAGLNNAGNLTISGSACDSQSSNSMYIFNRIATENGLTIKE